MPSSHDYDFGLYKDDGLRITKASSGQTEQIVTPCKLIRNPEFGLWNPESGLWNPNRQTWNLESTAWNPESKTLSDYLGAMGNFDGAKVKKDFCNIFGKHGVKITIEANKQIVNFLDVSLSLSDGTHMPFNMPNNIPLYT